MTEFFNIITNFGFPIALSCYLLLRFEKILDGLQKTNTQLVDKNVELIEEIVSLKKEVSGLKRTISRSKK